MASLRHALACALFSLLAIPAVAQDPSLVQVALTAASMERKAVVADRMQLSEEESREFWEIYNEYLQKHEKLNQELAGLLQTLAREFETLDDRTAKDLLKDYHEFRKDRLDLRWRTVKKLQKTLSAKRAARLYQIENKLDTLADMELVKGVPLVE
jgi:predicted RNase H-like nuclease (RuvC/YqgF family)